MKKKALLLLSLSVLALTSCGKTVNIKNDQNYDVDLISSITDDGGTNDFDSISVEEEEVERIKALNFNLNGNVYFFHVRNLLNHS